jgi:hypothetical protein
LIVEKVISVSSEWTGIFSPPTFFCRSSVQDTENMEFGNKLKELRAKIKINQPARQVLAGDYFFLLFLPYLA